VVHGPVGPEDVLVTVATVLAVPPLPWVALLVPLVVADAAASAVPLPVAGPAVDAVPLVELPLDALPLEALPLEVLPFAELPLVTPVVALVPVAPVEPLVAGPSVVPAALLSAGSDVVSPALELHATAIPTSDTPRARPRNAIAHRGLLIPLG
jgi:hypothetical protein